MKDNTIDAEIVEDEFKAPILKDIKYPVSEDVLKSLVEKYSEIPDIDLDADDEIVAAQYKIVRNGHIELSKKRNEIEKTRKAIKDPAFTFGKNVDAFAKKLQAIIADTEIKLKFQRDKVDQNEARKQREVEEAEELRISTIKDNIKLIANLPLENINKTSQEIQEAMISNIAPTHDKFQEFHDEAMGISANTQMQLQVMFDNTVKSENADKILAEQKEEQLQKEIELREVQKLEQAKIDKEREDFEEEKRKFAQQQQDIQDEAERIQADKDAEELLKQQEAERIAKSAQDEKDFNYAKLDSLGVIKNYSDDAESLLDAIINNEIPYVNWEM